MVMFYDYCFSSKSNMNFDKETKKISQSKQLFYYLCSSVCYALKEITKYCFMWDDVHQQKKKVNK